MSTTPESTKDFLARLRKQVERENKRKEAKDNDAEHPSRFLKLRDGESVVVRLFPAKEGLEEGLALGHDPFLEQEVHWGLGPKKNRSARCPRRGFKTTGPCAICDAVDERKKSKDPIDVKFVREMRAKSRYIFNVLVIGREDEGVLIWETSYTPFTDIRKYILNPQYGFSIFNPYDGINLTITRRGEETSTTYEIVPDRLSTPCGTDEQIAAWMEDMVDLQFFRQVQFTYEETQAFLSGEANPPSDLERPAESEAEATPRSRVKTKA